MRLNRCLSIALACSMLPFTAAWSRTFTVKNLNYEVISETDHTVRVKSPTEPEGIAITNILTIPATVTDPSGAGVYSVVEIGEGAFRGRTISYMIIEPGEGTLRFAEYAMASVDLRGLTVSRDFTAPANHEPFYGLTSLVDLALGNGITRVPAFAFMKSGIRYVRIPASVESIGYAAFEQTDLLRVDFDSDSRLKYIFGEAFQDCKKLKNPVYLPEGLVKIGEFAFQYSGITSISLPASLQEIGNCAFRGCSDLSAMSPAAGSRYRYSNGLLMSADRKTVYQAFDIDRFLTVPEGVTTIAAFAFSGLNVKSVTLPSTLTTIEENAFDPNWNMSTLNLPEGLVSIGESGLGRCTALWTLQLPESLQSIGPKCFWGLGVSSINIPASLKVIPEKAFELSRLKSIEIPETVVAVGSRAFERCTSLESVKFGSKWETVRKIEPATFIGCTALKEVTLPRFLSSIGDEAFYGCRELKSILLPAALKTIGEHAFDSIPDLAELSSCAPEPPLLPLNAFSNKVYRKATLKVPEGYAQIYRSAPVWELFANIVESPDLSGIDDISADLPEDAVTVYRLDGVLVYRGKRSAMPVLAPGVYIVNGRKIRF